MIVVLKFATLGAQQEPTTLLTFCSFEQYKNHLQMMPLHVSLFQFLQAVTTCEPPPTTSTPTTFAPTTSTPTTFAHTTPFSTSSPTLLLIGKQTKCLQWCLLDRTVFGIYTRMFQGVLSFRCHETTDYLNNAISTEIILLGQIQASPGIARVKFWSIVLIAYHYIVLRDNGPEPSDSKDNRPV